MRCKSVEEAAMIIVSATQLDFRFTFVTFKFTYYAIRNMQVAIRNQSTTKQR